jgi:hypothetical protein
MVDQVAGEVIAKRAVPLRKLTKLKLVRAAEAELQEELIRAGLERTARHVRVPLPAQLRTLLGDASLVPLTGLGRKLGGATQTEAKAAAFDLVRAGELRLVVADGKDHLARPSTEQLDASAIRSLSAAVARIAQLLRKAAPKRGQPDRSLRRSEVARLLVEANRLSAIGGDGV